jgi:PhoD-like phosphatase
MRTFVQTGYAVAEATYAHSVHLEVHGLDPGRPYWYRFVSKDAQSRIGRAWTAPPAGRSLGQLRFGFVSCANYEHGYFAAYRHLADQSSDLVLFLGDYIYEYVDRIRPTVRRHSDDAEADALPLIGTATRSTGWIRISSASTRRRRSSSPGTTTRSRTTTPTAGRNRSTIPRCSSGGGPPRTGRSTSTCRSDRAGLGPREPRSACMIASPTGTSWSSRCWTSGSIDPGRHAPDRRTRVAATSSSVSCARSGRIPAAPFSARRNDLKQSFDDPRSPTVATELVDTSISSIGASYSEFMAWMPDNPHVHFFDSRQRGYVFVELTPGRMTAHLRVLSDVRDPRASVSTLRSYVGESGRPGAVPA